MLLYLTIACTAKSTPLLVDSAMACDPQADADGDGIDACTEANLGTEDTEIDSDGDGDSDAKELDCLSDPTDSNEACYTCGWKRSNPGTFESTGSNDGDVIANIPFYDQCGEAVPLYDFADGYNVLYMTTEWCGACAQEINDLPDKADRFLELYGFEVRYLIALFQDNDSETPKPEVAIQYADRAEMTRFPVLADIEGLVLDSTPYDGQRLPGKCALSPEMDILGCATGSAAEEFIFTLILDHSDNTMQ